MTLGEQIALQRKQKGFTQESISGLTGISLRTIQRIENNKAIPRAYTLKKIADLLQLDATAILKAHHTAADTSGSGFIRMAQRMNLACFSVVLFPILPLIIMMVIRIRNNKDEALNIAGKRIIAFQVFWLILTLLILSFTKIIYYYITGAHSIGHISPLLPVYLIMLTVNLIFIVYSAFRLQQQELGIYKYIPVLF